jgi:hypothetical protein
MEASKAEEEQEGQLACTTEKWSSGKKRRDEYVRPLRIDWSYVSHCLDVCTTNKRELTR